MGILGQELASEIGSGSFVGNRFKHKNKENI